MKVFLVPNFYKNEAVQSGLTLELWLSRQGYEVAWAADQRSGIPPISMGATSSSRWEATVRSCVPSGLSAIGRFPSSAYPTGTLVS